MQPQNIQSTTTKAPEIQELEAMIKLLMVREAWSIAGLLEKQKTVATTRIITL
jgi:hypothetical protein